MATATCSRGRPCALTAPCITARTTSSHAGLISCWSIATSRSSWGARGSPTSSASIAGRGVAAAGAIVWLLGMPVSGQGQTYRAPRTADGKPNLNGIWQAVNTANWDVQDHAARQGPVVALGAAFSIPGGLGVVEGNEIP